MEYVLTKCSRRDWKIARNCVPFGVTGLSISMGLVTREWFSGVLSCAQRKEQEGG